MQDVVHNLQSVRAQIDAAAVLAGRDPAEVTLIAVSKGQPEAAIRAAYAAGQRDFGENYVQEWQGKSQALADLMDLRWHFLGHLQRNKVKLVIGKVHLLHAVDDMQGLDEMARTAHTARVHQDVLLQVNLADEGQKRGCTEDDAELFTEVLMRSPGLRLQGLMVLPPASDDPEASRPWFQRLRNLRDRLAKAHAGQPQAPRRWLLSMGMSADFAVAIAEGATHVRVGTAIFGPRLGHA
jgi:pyridoxal phosphate enzyme (YggS family)